MTKGNLGHRKHARLFLAMFVFGIVGIGTQQAHATIMGMMSPFQLFITPTPVVTTSTVGLPALTSPTLYTAPNPASSPFNFAVFGLFSGQRLSFSSIPGVASSVSGTVTAPVSAAPVTASAIPVAAGPFTPNPEPATMLLFGSGLLGVIVIGRRRFHQN